MKKKKIRYEPKVKEFYIKYFESVGYNREEGLKFYEESRTHINKLEKSLK